MLLLAPIHMDAEDAGCNESAILLTKEGGLPGKLTAKPQSCGVFDNLRRL